MQGSYRCLFPRLPSRRLTAAGPSTRFSPSAGSPRRPGLASEQRSNWLLLPSAAPFPIMLTQGRRLGFPCAGDQAESKAKVRMDHVTLHVSWQVKQLLSGFALQAQRVVFQRAASILMPCFGREMGCVSAREWPQIAKYGSYIYRLDYIHALGFQLHTLSD